MPHPLHPSSLRPLGADHARTLQRWSQRMAALTMDAAAHKVWKWTPTYPTELVKTNSAPAAGA